MINLEGKWTKKSKYGKVLFWIVVGLVLYGIGWGIALNLYWLYSWSWTRMWI